MSPPTTACTLPTPAAAPTLAHRLLNVVLLQAAWFVAVLGAARFGNGPAWLAACATLLWHLKMSGSPREELKLAACITLMGVLIETLNAQLGWLQARATLADNFPAPWLIALWLLFAASLNVTLRWLRPYRWGAAALGAVAGPLAYAGGARLDALQLNNPTAALLSLSLLWALALPTMLWLAQRFDGVSKHDH
jgi:hypothetical protein